MEVMRGWPDGCIDCCVTSPPYWGLRDYGVDGQLGLESTPEEYTARMVEVFAEVKRVLKPSGTLWLNLGDSYNGSFKGAWGKQDQQKEDYVPAPGMPVSNAPGLKPKDLIGIPWLIAFALRADGWYLRQDIIWHKNNPMPESCQDRPTSAHEHIFLFSQSGRTLWWRHKLTREWSATKPEPDYIWTHKSTREVVVKQPSDAENWSRQDQWRGMDYWYDADAIAEPVTESTIARLNQNIEAQQGSLRAHGGAKINGPMKAVSPRDSFERETKETLIPGQTAKQHRLNRGKGNRKSFRGGGAYTQGNSFDNSASQENETHGNEPNPAGTRNARNVWIIATKPYKEAHFATFPPELPRKCILAGCPPEGVVLDPFFGSGTVGEVAAQLGRNWVGIELNPKYVALATKRTQQQGIFA